jgi:hypothetical protein
LLMLNHGLVGTEATEKTTVSAFNVVKQRDHNKNGYITINSDVYNKLPMDSTSNFKKFQKLPNFSFYSGVIENYMTLHTITAMDMDHIQYANYIDSKEITPYNLQDGHLTTFMYTAYVIMFHHVSQILGCDDIFLTHENMLKTYKNANCDRRILKINDYNVAIQRFRTSKTAQNNTNQAEIVEHIQKLFELEYVRYTYSYCDKLVSPFIDRFLYKTRIQKMTNSYLMFDLINSNELVWTRYRHLAQSYGMYCKQHNTTLQCLVKMSEATYQQANAVWEDLWVHIDSNPIKKANIIDGTEEQVHNKIQERLGGMLDVITEIEDADDGVEEDDEQKVIDIINGLPTFSMEKLVSEVAAIESEHATTGSETNAEDTADAKENEQTKIAKAAFINKSNAECSDDCYETNITNSSSNEETQTIARARWAKAFDAVINGCKISLPLQKIQVDRPYMHLFGGIIHYDPGYTINFKFRGDYSFGLYVEGGCEIKKVGFDTNTAAYIYIEEELLFVATKQMARVFNRPRLTWIKTRKKEAIQYIKVRKGFKKKSLAYTNVRHPLIIDEDLMDYVCKHHNANGFFSILNSIFSNVIVQ